MDIIVQTFGSSISKEGDYIIISNCKEQKSIHCSDITSIHVYKGVSISSDAIFLAVQKEIDILFYSKDGNMLGRVWSGKYGSISNIRRGQLNFLKSPEAVHWIKEIIVNKINNQQALLIAFEQKNREIVERAISRMEDYIHKINDLEGDIISDVSASLRGWEGNASKIYFETINNFLPERLKFSQRSQHPALDPVNACLNYGYGILYGKIESCLLKVGLDPYLGVMHRNEYNRPVLVYDVIEKYRVWVDYVTFQLAAQGAISEDLYSYKEDGSCWLEYLGRRIMIQSVEEYLNEETIYNKLKRSRETHMFLYVQHLAQILKVFVDE